MWTKYSKCIIFHLALNHELSETHKQVTYLNGGISQCELVSICNGDYDSILVINDEFECSFFDRVYSCLIEETEILEVLKTSLNTNLLYTDDSISDAMEVDRKYDVLDKYKASRKVYASIRKYLGEPIFLKYHLLELFSNVLAYQQSIENFRRKPKSQLRCMFSLMILNIEYNINFKRDQIKCAKHVLTTNQNSDDKSFLDLINQWVDLYVDDHEILTGIMMHGESAEFCIDTRLMAKFPFEFFDFDSLNHFFRSNKHSAAFLTSYLFLLMSKSENFVEILSKKTLVNTFVDDQNDVRSTLKENSDFAIEFYSILFANILLNKKFLDKFELPSTSVSKEFKNKKYSLMQRLLNAKIIDSHTVAINFGKIFENLFEPSYYLFVEELFTSSTLYSDPECFFEGIKH